MAFVKSELSS